MDDSRDQTSAFSRKGGEKGETSEKLTGLQHASAQQVSCASQRVSEQHAKP